MNRRTDRAIAISAISAVVVVPTAVLAVVKTNGASPKDPGEMPPAAAAAQHDPARVGQSPVPGAPAGSSSPLPGAGVPGPGPGAGAGASPGRPSGESGTSSSGRPSGRPAALRSFTRLTDVKLAVAANGDYDHATETTTFTLSPAFAMRAVGQRRTMKAGKLTTLTQQVIISGSTLKSFDGKAWESSTLTASQLKKLREDSDPRQITWLAAGVPGMSRTGPDKFGSTHLLAKALMGDVYGRLPKDVAAETRKVLPDSTGVALDLWSDRGDRPSWIGLTASAPGASFNGSMTFKSYR